MHHVIRLTLLFTLLTAMPVFAHDGHMHILGTIVTLDDDRIVVNGKDGKTIPISVTDKTTYRAQHDAKASLKIGDRVVVEVAHENGVLIANEIRFASGKPRP
jgi:hypothetical protein